MLSRRQILAGVGATAVLAFNTKAHAWSARRGGADFRRLPDLGRAVLSDSRSVTIAQGQKPPPPPEYLETVASSRRKDRAPLDAILRRTRSSRSLRRGQRGGPAFSGGRGPSGHGRSRNQIDVSAFGRVNELVTRHSRAAMAPGSQSYRYLPVCNPRGYV